MAKFTSQHSGRGKPVQLDPQFADELEKLAKLLETWSIKGIARLIVAHKKIGQRHRTEAVKRVPVDTGRLRNAILTNVYEEPGAIITETGTNVRDYPAFVEFGTKYIAKGNVKKLGKDPDISDAQAIKVWPAKNKDRIDKKTGKVHRTAVMEYERRAGGTGVGEQMPWLRTSFTAIRGWAIKQLIEALEPPTGRSGSSVAPSAPPSSGGGSSRGFLGRAWDAVKGWFGRG